MRKILFLLFTLMMVVGCGKSSDYTNYNVPKKTPTPDATITPPTVESTKTFTFPNYNDESSLQSKTYYLTEDATFRIPSKITVNKEKNNKIYMIFENFYCTFDKVSATEFSNTNCLSDISLAVNESVYIYGISFGTVVTVTLSFK